MRLLLKPKADGFRLV